MRQDHVCHTGGNIYFQEFLMAVTKEQVLATAALARLDLREGLSDEESEALITAIAAQMAEVVGYMDILNSVDTEGVEPMYSPMREVAPPREDTAVKRGNAEAILANAPERHSTFFVVPPVL
jgi:aspartyl/glutamyl-tRNA(Asn/Gln) amidotransferase, C subunit